MNRLVIAAAGFGSCTVVLADPERLETWWIALKLRHRSIARIA
jgi:hypothetical protein